MVMSVRCSYGVCCLVHLFLCKALRLEDAAGPETVDIEAELANKFSHGDILVHMKRDFRKPDSQLARWQHQDGIDQSLSFSLIHPGMPLQQLWVKHGYFFDASRCQPLIGSMADLWVNNEVQHGSHMILTTPEGQRAELLRMMWLRYKKGGRPVHVVYPEGFEQWAANPEKWSEDEKSVFTVKNPYSDKDTFAEVPAASALHEFLAAVDAGTTPIFRVADLHELSTSIVQDYNMVPDVAIKFTEVLAFCPLQALEGYIYSTQGYTEEQLAELRAGKLKEGREVLQAVRRKVPALAGQALLIAEYSITTDEDLEKKVNGLKPSAAKHHLAMEKVSGQQIQLLDWKDGYSARLKIIETDSPRVGVE